MARCKSGALGRLIMFYGKWPSGHFAWICLPTQERANKAKHDQLVLFVYLGQYWLFGIDHWLSLKPLFTD